MEFKALLFEIEDGIATITMNRPELLNAVNMDMRLDFTALMDELFFNEEIKRYNFNSWIEIKDRA